MENTIGFKELVSNNRTARELNAQAFERIFKTSLHRFMHPLFGLDVVKLDEFISPFENESTSQAISRKYGGEALTLVKMIMDMELSGTAP